VGGKRGGVRPRGGGFGGVGGVEVDDTVGVQVCYGFRSVQREEGNQ